MDDFLKENRITQEDIIFAVRAEKFKNMVVGKKAKPTQKEISKFYSDNRENLFTEPESVHVRHILVTLGKEEDDNVQAEKKEKIENLRNQLLNGGNFAELAAKNSDCPSKEVGGDLNFLRRGQTVKAFEDAAFSQEKNAIGPVVKTEFGYHIIQVLDKRPSKKVALEDVKDRISNHLEQAKQVEVFNAVLNDLKEKAKIEIY
jgi:peptidyl-prolyl cis-trans isomerase C